MKIRLRTVAELVVNLALPWVAYTLTEPHYGKFYALIASSVPPILWSLGELIWHRRVDALSMFVLGGIGLSIVAMALGGDERLLLVRESLLTGLIGLAFLVSLLFPKPLVYFLARATVMRQDSENGSEDFQDWWQEPASRSCIRGITAVWGLGFSGEAVIKTWLAWNWEPDRFLAIAPAMGYAVAGAMGLWTFWYVRRLGRQGEPESSKPSVDSE